MYSAGLYSFFNSYDASQFTPLIMSAIVPATNFVNEQSAPRMEVNRTARTRFSASRVSAITVYNLNVLGSQSLVDKDGHSLASYTILLAFSPTSSLISLPSELSSARVVDEVCQQEERDQWCTCALVTRLRF